MLPTDFVAGTALYGRIVIIHIVELNLDHFYLRVLGQNLLKHFRFVMERNADVAYFSFFFQFKCGLVCMALFKMRIVSGTLCMHQIEIKIINTADLQLAFKL